MNVPRIRLDVPIRGSFNLRRFSTSAVLVVGSALVANVFSYVFHFVLSRKLGPDQYGTLATMMVVGGIFGVLGSSVGTVAMQEAARMWSAHLDDLIPQFVRKTGKFVLGFAAIVAIALVVVSVPLGAYLHVVKATIWLTVATWVALTLLELYARGSAQGAHRFAIFSASTLSEGILKVVLAVTFVLAGYGVGGALGGLLCATLIGLLVAAVPMSLGGRHEDQHVPEHLRLGGDALRVLAINVAASALLFIDLLFAKHHLSGAAAGYFGAAGTVAKTIPYSVGLIALILMPAAAAARHSSRESLRHILLVATLLAGCAIAVALAIIVLFPQQLIGITYGQRFSGAIPLLRLYAIDEALLALWAIASSYLIAIGQYRLFSYLSAAVVVEAGCMALFGSTPVRLLTIAIAVNALLVPAVWALALRSLRALPQAANPPAAETNNEPSSAKGPEFV
ncbi:MAG TPA: hypothetical protein VKR99_06335 [Candidatus Eremiobacteraceae bacterium]|nr:hypothetical protein [Candidatus Eremiobacteraceae bacterium]